MRSRCWFERMSEARSYQQPYAAPAISTRGYSLPYVISAAAVNSE
jgi:hypothetical protein